MTSVRDVRRDLTSHLQDVALTANGYLADLIAETHAITADNVTDARLLADKLLSVLEDIDALREQTEVSTEPFYDPVRPVMGVGGDGVRFKA